MALKILVAYITFHCFLGSSPIVCFVVDEDNDNVQKEEIVLEDTILQKCILR